MDRARRHPNRRKPFGNTSSASPQSRSEPSFGRLSSSTSPVMSHSAGTSPQGRRAGKPLQHAFTFSTPGSSRNPGLKKRSRTVDNYGVPEPDGDDDDEDGHGAKKGGHSLRKRARVDYTFEHIDDEVVVPNSTLASRSGRKRRADGTDDAEELYGPAPRRRRTASPDTPSSRRRNPSRKAIESRAYRDEAGDDEQETKDTIEVGGSYSDVDEPDLPQPVKSSTSSPNQLIHPSGQAANGISPVDAFYGPKTANDSDTVKQQTPEPAVNPGTVENSREVEEFDNDPASQLQRESSDVQSKVEESAQTHSGLDSMADRSLEPSPKSPPASMKELSQQTIPAFGESALEDTAVPTEAETSTSGAGDATERSVQFPQETNREVEASQRSPQPTQHPQKASQAQAPATNTEDTGKPTSGTEANAESMYIDEVPEAQSSVAPATSSDGSQVSLADVKSTETIPTVVEETTAMGCPAPTQPEIIGSSSRTQPEKEAAPTSIISKASETQMPSPSKVSKQSRPQPTPVGRWAHLTPYLDGEFASYPEKKARSDDDAAGEDQPTEEKDTDKEGNEMEPMVEDNDDAPDAAMPDVPTPALNTPTRGSPAPDSMEPTAFNSPAPAGDEPDEADISESQEPPEARRYFKYRKLRDPEDYITAVANFEQMSTAELWEVLDACNVSLLQWQSEYAQLGKTVDDYENAQRRRIADTKYESRTRNLHQHGVNYDEPDFATKGYKAREKEVMSETRYLQGQDRIMAAVYGFEYDPHPSKIGRQNPETQQVGIMTRGRSLRNQPRQTAKATEADEVVGKRQRKPVQLFDPATQQDISRSSTPVPTRSRRRKNANVDNDEPQPNTTSSFNEEAHSDGETTAPRRGRKRGPRPKAAVPSIVEVLATDTPRSSPAREEPVRSGRRGRGRAVEYEDYPFHFVDTRADQTPKSSKRSIRVEAQSEPRQPKRMLTLKMPNSKNFSGASSVITDNGDSRPSTASSDSSTHTAESSYSFRPKRQKRFREDPDDETLAQAPPKKRGRRSNIGPGADDFIPQTEYGTPEPPQSQADRKVHRIKLVRPPPEASRNGTPSSLPNTDDGDRKEYKAMTKSEKMSASMKSRWANGNMAGAVEKRKATLAAKKAAQAAAEQRVGPIAPKPKAKPGKKESPPAQGPPAEWPSGLAGVGYPFSANQ